MSPSLASSATNAGSFFSSSLWKRVFSRQRMSPSFNAATASCATSPTQSSAKAIGRLITCASAAATGFSESLGSGPLGRPKCASRITLPPLSEISVMVGATRSSRVASLTRPLSIGTLRSTRSSTRLPFTSTSSRVRNLFMPRFLRHGRACPGHPRLDRRKKTWMPGTRPGMTINFSEQLPHRHGGIGHAVGETPFIVVPGHHPYQRPVQHLGLVHVEGGRMRVVVEVDGDVGRGGVAKNALQLLLGSALHRLVDFLHVGLARRDDLEIDHRDIRGR